MGISFRKGPKGRYDREHQERTRQKIADSNVLARLIKGFNGEIELTPQQVAIGLKMLDKLVPNLQSVEQEVTQNSPFAVLPAPAPSADAWHKAFSPKASVAGTTRATVPTKSQDKPH